MDESFIIGSITSHADFKTAFFKLWVTERGKVSCTKFEMMSSCRESNIKIWLHFIFQHVDLCVLTMYLPKKVLGIRQLHGLRLGLGYP